MRLRFDSDWDPWYRPGVEARPGTDAAALGVTTLILDLIYPILDPRITYKKT